VFAVCKNLLTFALITMCNRAIVNEASILGYQTDTGK